MRRRAPSTTSRSGSSRRTSGRSAAAARSSSSRIASRPCATRTGSWYSIGGSSSSREVTPSSWRGRASITISSPSSPPESPMPSPKRLPPPTEVLDPHPDAPKLAIVKAEARGRELTPLEREFLPPLLEIQETPPSPVNRWVAGTLIVLVIALIVWATVGKVSIVATAPGKFIPDGRLKQIQPLESSIVRSIDVTEGQRVRKGQLLIELDPTLSAAALNANAQKYGFNRLEQARLVAELTDRKPDYTGLDEPRAEVLLEERIRRAQEQDYAAKLAEAQAAVEEKSAALAAAQASLTKYRQMTALAEEQVASARPLVPIGAISRIDYLKLEEALIQNRN